MRDQTRRKLTYGASLPVLSRFRLLFVAALVRYVFASTFVRPTHGQHDRYPVAFSKFREVSRTCLQGVLTAPTPPARTDLSPFLVLSVLPLSLVPTLLFPSADFINFVFILLCLPSQHHK